MNFKYLFLALLLVLCTSCSDDSSSSFLGEGITQEDLLTYGDLNTSKEINNGISKEKIDSVIDVITKRKALDNQEYNKELENNRISAKETGSTIINITFPKKVKQFETASHRVIIWGEILNSKNVHDVKVNDWSLKKYYPGQKVFSYIASESLGTLKEGDNIYKIQALDKDGNLISETEYKIIQNEMYASLADTGFDSILYVLILSIFAYIVFEKRKIFELLYKN